MPRAAAPLLLPRRGAKGEAAISVSGGGCGEVRCACGGLFRREVGVWESSPPAETEAPAPL